MSKVSVYLRVLALIFSLGLSFPTSTFADSELARDGTYIGTGEGRNGPVKVRVTIVKGFISNIIVLKHQETPVITREALEDFPREMAERGFLGVDAVAGATETCEAIRDAVADCLKKAGSNPGQYGYPDKTTVSKPIQAIDSPQNQS